MQQLTQDARSSNAVIPVCKTPRYCAIWGTDDALQRSSKPHLDSDESTPFAPYDCSLLTTDRKLLDPTGRSRSHRQDPPMLGTHELEFSGFVGSGVGSHRTACRGGDATRFRCLPLRLIFPKKRSKLGSY